MIKKICKLFGYELSRIEKPEQFMFGQTVVENDPEWKPDNTFSEIEALQKQLEDCQAYNKNRVELCEKHYAQGWSDALRMGIGGIRAGRIAYLLWLEDQDRSNRNV